MGTRAASLKPERLAEKLLQVRLALGLSQGEMTRRLGLEDTLNRSEISAFEHGLRVPPLKILLAYATAAGVSTDVLIDDELDLPVRLPRTSKRR